tara:strand:- start:5257 stop:5763 length:507 start_codon:yes stop_codon:yes gene_type:complete
MGAGILPMCLFQSRILFLFGKDKKTNFWSDFGGRQEFNETLFDTAIREGGEELNGFLGSGKQLYDLVEKNNLLTIHYDKYKVFVFLFKYDKNLPKYFNNNNDFMSETELLKSRKNNKDGLFEKSEIDWFTIDDLSNNRNNFRLFYRPIIDILVQESHTLLVNINKLKI